MSLSKREAMISLLQGGKVRHESFAKNSYYEMTERMTIVLTDPGGQRNTVSEIIDGSYDYFVKMVERSEKGFLSVSAIANLSVNGETRVTLQLQREPSVRSYIPVTITWEEEESDIPY